MNKKIAYFSMEIGLRSDLPTFSGGLGVLAGDTIKAAADLDIPMVAVTLLYRKGYFRQAIGDRGRQEESPVFWNVEDFLEPTQHLLRVPVHGREIHLGVWRYKVRGASGHEVPVYFLDAKRAENNGEDQALTDCLYGGDDTYRLLQETLLGIGGVQLVDCLSEQSHLEDPWTFHMNEGHASLLTWGLMLSLAKGEGRRPKKEDLAIIRERCVFTTHTPVKAGHDSFDVDLVQKVLGSEWVSDLRDCQLLLDNRLNLTHLALVGARFVNGVAKRHGEVSRKMFPGFSIQAITNGVHVETWLSEGMRELVDREVPLWRRDNHYLRDLIEIDPHAIELAHGKSKRLLIDEILLQLGTRWSEDAFTIGFARRAATYKRADMLFSDLKRLETMAERYPRPLQVVFSGKAHPRDEGGKKLIENVFEAARNLDPQKVSVVFLPNYDMRLGKLITSGVDLWLNNPVKPLEASGTSGMKAALNGVPSLSTLDGWWVEGCIEGVTGWEILDEEDGLLSSSEAGDCTMDAAKHLYEVLEAKILPMYYENRAAYSCIRRNAVALNGSYFSAQRMMQQYDRLSYGRI